VPILLAFLKAGGITALVIGVIYLLFRQPLKRALLNIPLQRRASVVLSVLFCLWSIAVLSTVLAYLAGRCPPPPVLACKSPFPAPEVKESETNWEQATIIGEWLYDSENKTFIATWNNVRARVKLLSASGAVYTLQRVDEGAGSGVTADYVGHVLPNMQLSGLCSIEGSVTWHLPGGDSQGTWSATWP